MPRDLLFTGRLVPLLFFPDFLLDLSVRECANVCDNVFDWVRIGDFGSDRCTETISASASVTLSLT